MVDQEPDIHLHSHGQEKQGHEHDPKGVKGVVHPAGLLGGSQENTRHERPEGGGQPQQSRAQGKSETENQGEKNLQFPAVLVQNGQGKPYPSHLDKENKQGYDAPHAQYLEADCGKGGRLAAKQLEHDEHDDHRHVLGKQDADDVLPHEGIRLPPLVEELQDDRRAAQADHESQQDDPVQRPVEPKADKAHRPDTRPKSETGCRG